MKRINSLMLFLLALTAVTTSCSDDKESSAGITDQSWTEGETLEISTEKDVTVRFTAYGKWAASVTDGADWCMLSQTSGNKGSHSFIVSVNGETTTDRTATITLNANSNPSSFKVMQKASGNAVVNREVDKYLNEMYLWNSEYKALAKDFSQDYENFFYGNLLSMNTNTLDKKSYIGSDGNIKYNLFSYIQKKNPIGTRATTQIAREQEYSFGFTGMIAIRMGGGEMALCPQGIYPESPATENEVKRGTYLYKIDGKAITPNNYNQVYVQLMLPGRATTINLTEIELDDDGNFKRNENNSLRTRDVTLTARAMYKNPILYHDVITSENGHKIGYLVYENFDAGFDDDLFDIFKKFKTEGIQDLILDLRYNGGGYVISSNLIASCVAGSSCSDKVFAQYRYNEERMKKIANLQPKEKFAYDWYANLKTSLAAGDLNLKRLYCLVSSNTASASELLINSLRGIDVNVVLIGDQTTGKNVGMEPKDIIVEKDTYEVVPITFQTYNAKGFGEYENGFQPDIALIEEDANGDGYFDHYLRFGHPREPLLTRALQEITGVKTSDTRSLMRTPANGKASPLPVILRPGHYGMMK